MISAMQLQTIMPHAADRIATFIGPLNDCMEEFAIGTARRVAAFLAQISHESGELRYTRELASGREYEGRADLGNTMPGDGERFAGRGLIQVTGRANYTACGEALGLTLVLHPELLEQPINACRSAGWFWKSRGLNELADADKFGAVTRRINGGFNGLDERISFWLAAREACGL